MFEVQQWTLCQGWVNTWSVDDQPQRFETLEAAQAELDEFFDDIQAEIDRGERDPEEGYAREDFRIEEVS